MYWKAGLKKSISGIVVCVISLWCLLSCGLQVFYYIDYIPEGTYDNMTYAQIKLPNDKRDGYGTYFDNFIIFYRIYISTLNISAITPIKNESQLQKEINTALQSNYNNLYPYTLVNTDKAVNTSNLESTFQNSYGFYKLALEGSNINTVLNENSLGGTLEFDFTDDNTGNIPKLILNRKEYNMRRATDGLSITFTPVPEDRYFRNDPLLYDNKNATPTTKAINADTVASQSTLDIMYTYVLMYIAAEGRSLEMPPTTIYSQPTFVGIFKLPGMGM